jgi:DNA-binding NtrC family response regulator
MALTVLLVDDDPFVLKVLGRQLAAPHVTVFTARHAGEALRVLGTRRVDVLVTDQVMRTMSGDALVREARHLQPNLTPVLISGDEENARVAMRDERTPVFGKSFALRELAGLILGTSAPAQAA